MRDRVEVNRPWKILAAQAGWSPFHFLVAIHAGSYDNLGDTYAAMERWMEVNGYRPGAPPWESYVTDPAEFPDSKDWRTEVFWRIETKPSQ
jgi:effector-binding domain-containing protein